MIKDDISFGLGQAMVATTNNRGHDPEFWAEQTTNRICGISEQAAPHIKEQALAFRTVANKLQEIGHGDVAKFLKEL